MPCPLCGDEIETNVARSGSQASQHFYKCIRYDARQCRFFEFQRMKLAYEIVSMKGNKGDIPEFLYDVIID
ncbi:hypothetical protein TRIUR3_05133 [Triticum urartu]|nr:hypothetical protein TRIUR3_05133 [Triticum urartu]